MKRAVLWTLAAMTAPTAHGDDWPQWMGPHRDNSWREHGVLVKFPTGGPKVLWKAPVAGGYAGPAVASGKVFVADYVTSENVKVDNFNGKKFSGVERVLCLDEATGAEKWKHEYPVTYGISYPAGPRCTPIVHLGKVYTLGAEGNLFCFDAETGKIHWAKNLPVDYKTKTALWGYAAHPLVDGKKLICLVGGAGTHAVAFDLDSGAELWRSQSAAQQGYSPPTIIAAGGVRQLILVNPEAVTSVDPENGGPYWSVPYKADNGGVIMSPVRVGEYLYVGGYNDRNLLLKLASDKPAAELVWRDKIGYGVSPINVQPFPEENLLYGFDQSGAFLAVEIPSGDRLWKTGEPVAKRLANSATAFIIKHDSQFWLFTEKGDLVIGRLSRTGFTEIDRAKIIEPTNNAFGRDVVWCPPAFADKRIFVRNDKECVCIDLAQ